MGVPAFYRWITRRYPLIVVDAVEREDSAAAGDGLEYDNLYLDMNGIVHSCFHPEDKPAPSSFDEVFENIFQNIDRLVAIVRPRKLLYMAIDGVAPRAKMNQQRSRRFRAAKDGNEEKGETSDSNVITPGTEFMALLSDALNHYIQLRISQNIIWQRMAIILSAANVPGEGEHKIMNFIRLQRNLPGFNPNTRHCLYGLDADLIMLALATHELHFSILREVPSSPRKCYLCGEAGHIAKFCDGTQKSTVEETDEVPYQFLHVWLLREYLEHELKAPDADFERIIDDFVFICFFVGNDFIPGLPTLDIRQGAIGTLMSIYKRELGNMNGYLTDNGEVNLGNLEYFLGMIGQIEDRVIQKQAQKHSEKIIDYSPDSDSYKQIYYDEKFGPSYSDALRKDLAQKYTEGLCWILHYYYRGVSSWQCMRKSNLSCLYYPFHYAPFASDLSGIGALEVRFEVGKPLKPFDMLMGVLPASSACALPEYYRILMTNPASPLIDFYPEDFAIDMNGKKYPWQGVVKLPFIDVERLLEETRKLEGTLSAAELKRNSFAQDLLFLCCHHPLATYIYASVEDTAGVCMISEGLNGFFSLNRKTLQAAVPHNVLCVEYICPSDHPHVPRLPDGVVVPTKTILDRDFRRHSFRGRHRSTSSGGSSEPYREHDQYHGKRSSSRRRSSSRTSDCVVNSSG